MSFTTISYLSGGAQHSINIPGVLSASEVEKLQEYFQNSPHEARKMVEQMRRQAPTAMPGQTQMRTPPSSTSSQADASHKLERGPYAGLNRDEAEFLEAAGWRKWWCDEKLIIELVVNDALTPEQRRRLLRLKMIEDEEPTPPETPPPEVVQQVLSVIPGLGALSLQEKRK
ncbi:hypothetical protein OPT61_g4653 [Boeremia exigua]|uniref:Uncharacterized protein n=1 Tax=Boeremia exigua TaxID=749465 RepID=A0ACC2IDB3_9PLEO|nr:hypothetical protein OPT61_g4653 [Boeremia exigua]